MHGSTRFSFFMLNILWRFGIHFHSRFLLLPDISACSTFVRQAALRVQLLATFVDARVEQGTAGAFRYAFQCIDHVAIVNTPWRFAPAARHYLAVCGAQPPPVLSFSCLLPSRHILLSLFRLRRLPCLRIHLPLL